MSSEESKVVTVEFGESQPSLFGKVRVKCLFVLFMHFIDIAC